MTDLHKLLDINKNHVIAVSIPASEYYSFCSVLKHKGYKTPDNFYGMPYNFLFIRHNRYLVTKCDTIPCDNRGYIYTHAIPHTTILQYLTTNGLKRIH